MKESFKLPVEHPIFGNCEVMLNCECHFERPSVIDGYVENPGGHMIDAFECVKIDDRSYCDRVLKSMDRFIENNYGWMLDSYFDNLVREL